MHPSYDSYSRAGIWLLQYILLVCFSHFAVSLWPVFACRNNWQLCIGSNSAWCQILGCTLCVLISNRSRCTNLSCVGSVFSPHRPSSPF